LTKGAVSQPPNKGFTGVQGGGATDALLPKLARTGEREMEKEHEQCRGCGSVGAGCLRVRHAGGCCQKKKRSGRFHTEGKTRVHVRGGESLGHATPFRMSRTKRRGSAGKDED